MRVNLGSRKCNGPWLPTLRPFGWLLLSIKSRNCLRSRSFLLLPRPWWSFGVDRNSIILSSPRFAHQSMMFVTFAGGTILHVWSFDTWSFLTKIVDMSACFCLILRKRRSLRLTNSQYVLDAGTTEGVVPIWVKYIFQKPLVLLVNIAIGSDIWRLVRFEPCTNHVCEYAHKFHQGFFTSTFGRGNVLILGTGRSSSLFF